MTYRELKNIFLELKHTSPREDLTAHVIFTEDSFASPRPLLSRTYFVSSDDDWFWSCTGGYSIFSYCLDRASGQGLRLDLCMADERAPDGWRVQDCYILEHMRDAASIPDAERAEQGDGTVCYFFGDTCIRAREIREDGRTRLEPVAGDQAACGEWTDLPIDRVHGYCTLLERSLNGE
ncbi:hypothetical protein [uncultured Alistipes sp.]|uniref:hypothetical protein n=1 Tax=uncultured Alistipes sp. TaxID=538949 RepID=UPI00272B91A8|nr:hypothetical protein [uncultured Alistipes sp.]